MNYWGDRKKVLQLFFSYKILFALDLEKKVISDGLLPQKMFFSLQK
jgi:hypothetical protein